MAKRRPPAGCGRPTGGGGGVMELAWSPLAQEAGAGGRRRLMSLGSRILTAPLPFHHLSPCTSLRLHFLS